MELRTPQKGTQLQKWQIKVHLERESLLPNTSNWGAISTANTVSIRLVLHMFTQALQVMKGPSHDLPTVGRAKKRVDDGIVRLTDTAPGSRRPCTTWHTRGPGKQRDAELRAAYVVAAPRARFVRRKRNAGLTYIKHHMTPIYSST